VKHYLKEDDIAELTEKMVKEYISKLHNQKAPVRGTQFDKLSNLIKDAISSAYSAGYANAEFDEAERE
jgi:hypothetical protein